MIYGQNPTGLQALLARGMPDKSAKPGIPPDLRSLVQNRIAQQKLQQAQQELLQSQQALQQTAAPVTPDGTPTVAGQAEQATQQMLAPQAMPSPMGSPQAQVLGPGVRQAAQMAGIAGQQQQAEQQQAMQAAMQMAQAQGQQGAQPMASGGIARLPAHNMARMEQYAHGGVIGFSGEGQSDVPSTLGYAPLYEEAKKYGIVLSPYDSAEERAQKIAQVQDLKVRKVEPPEQKSWLANLPEDSWARRMYEGRSLTDTTLEDLRKAGTKPWLQAFQESLAGTTPAAKPPAAPSAASQAAATPATGTPSATPVASVAASALTPQQIERAVAASAGAAPAAAPAAPAAPRYTMPTTAPAAPPTRPSAVQQALSTSAGIALPEAINQIQKALGTGEGIEQLTQANKDLYEARKAIPLQRQEELEALRKGAEERAALRKQAEEASPMERFITVMSGMGRAGLGGAGTAYAGYEQGQRAERARQIAEDQVEAAKRSLIVDAQNAQRVGDMEKYVNSMQKLEELRTNKNTAVASIAGHVLSAEATKESARIHGLSSIESAKIHQATAAMGLNKPSESERIMSQYAAIRNSQGPEAADAFLQDQSKIRAAVLGVKYEGKEADKDTERQLKLAAEIRARMKDRAGMIDTRLAAPNLKPEERTKLKALRAEMEKEVREEVYKDVPSLAPPAAAPAAAAPSLQEFLAKARAANQIGRAHV